MSVDANLRRLVRERAENCCEYCGCQQHELPVATVSDDFQLRNDRFKRSSFHGHLFSLRLPHQFSLI
mgnify:CR=1 FL=1